MINAAQTTTPQAAKQIFNDIAELADVKSFWLRYTVHNDSTELPFPIQENREGFVSIKDGIAFTTDRALAAEILVLATMDSTLRPLPDETRTLLGSVQGCVLLEEGLTEDHQKHFLKLKDDLKKANAARRPFIDSTLETTPDDNVFGGIITALHNDPVGSRIQVGWHGRDEDLHTDGFAEERHIVMTVCEATGRHCGSVIYMGDKSVLAAEEGNRKFKFDSPHAGRNLPAGIKYFVTPNRVPVFFRGAFGQDSTFHSGSKMPENGLRTIYAARSMDTRGIEFKDLLVEAAITPPAIAEKLPLAVYSTK